MTFENKSGTRIVNRNYGTGLNPHIAFIPGNYGNIAEVNQSVSGDSLYLNVLSQNAHVLYSKTYGSGVNPSIACEASGSSVNVVETNSSSDLSVTYADSTIFQNIPVLFDLMGKYDSGISISTSPILSGDYAGDYAELHTDTSCDNLYFDIIGQNNSLLVNTKVANNYFNGGASLCYLSSGTYQGDFDMISYSSGQLMSEIINQHGQVLGTPYIIDVAGLSSAAYITSGQNAGDVAIMASVMLQPNNNNYHLYIFNPNTSQASRFWIPQIQPTEYPNQGIGGLTYISSGKYAGDFAYDINMTMYIINQSGNIETQFPNYDSVTLFQLAFLSSGTYSGDIAEINSSYFSGRLTMNIINQEGNIIFTKNYSSGSHAALNFNPSVDQLIETHKAPSSSNLVMDLIKLG